MSHLVDIFLQPGRVFEAQRDKPTFWVPMLLIAALTAVFTITYFMRVDPVWHEAQMIAATSQQLSEQEVAQMKSAMPDAKTMGWIGGITSAVAVVVVTLLTALYVWVAAKLTGRSLGYRHGLSLSAWSAMPMVLGLVVALIGALTMAPQTAMESLMLTNVDPLFVDLPSEHRWNRLAQGLNLLTFWTVALFALGWRVWTRGSWMQAIVIALIPTVVVFGVIAVLPAP